MDEDSIDTSDIDKKHLTFIYLVKKLKEKIEEKKNNFLFLEKKKKYYNHNNIISYDSLSKKF